MKICHLTTVHPAKDARIYYRMCVGLAGKQIATTLIAPEPFKDEAYLHASSWNRRLGHASRPRRVGIALRAALAESADLYHFHDPELIPMALTLKAIRPSSAIVYDVHEDYPSMMQHKYWLPESLRPVASTGVSMAHWLAGKFLDGIITADNAVEQDFLRFAAGKIFCFYNFPTLALFGAPAPEPVAIPADLIYLGGISERSGIYVVLDALRLLRDRDGLRPTLRLAGYTDGQQGRRAIDEAIRARGLARQIEFHGRLAHDQVPNWLRAGRIGLVPLQQIDKFLKNIPSKMFEYWACGLPVIASDLPPARRFVKPGENGLLFSAGDAVSLALAMQNLLDAPQTAVMMGNAGKRRVESDWNNEAQIDGLIDFYRRICERSRLAPPADQVEDSSQLTNTEFHARNGLLLERA
jgi:glycosyltransferase involved in cell wall biosynthesis